MELGEAAVIGQGVSGCRCSAYAGWGVAGGCPLSGDMCDAICFAILVNERSARVLRGLLQQCEAMLAKLCKTERFVVTECRGTGSIYPTLSG